jgi:UDP-N-acetylmuramoylalanine--D-glutamate ligase
VAIGEAKSELRALTDAARYHEAESMEEAVRIACEVSRAGDVVLLAPGCASFDMFDDYGARGDAFAALVSEMGR